MSALIPGMRRCARHVRKEITQTAACKLGVCATVRMMRAHTSTDLMMLTTNDRRELRNYQRFLRLWQRFKLEMLQRPVWQKYLCLTPQEAWKVAKFQSALKKAKDADRRAVL